MNFVKWFVLSQNMHGHVFWFDIFTWLLILAYGCLVVHLWGCINKKWLGTWKVEPTRMYSYWCLMVLWTGSWRTWSNYIEQGPRTTMWGLKRWWNRNKGPVKMLLKILDKLVLVYVECRLWHIGISGFVQKHLHLHPTVSSGSKCNN